jgi:hypothetical protein
MSARAKAIASLRAHVVGLLHSGAAAADVSFALAYIATELGLVVSTKSNAVFQGVVAATRAHDGATNAPDDCKATDEPAIVVRPRNAALH